MDVYIYQAGTYCEDCANAIKRSFSDDIEKLAALTLAGADLRDETTFDSDEYPKGPYASFEADAPQHCHGCATFLESPLTDYGYGYVLEAIIDAWRAAPRTMYGTGSAENLTGSAAITDTIWTWANYYQDGYNGGKYAIVAAFLEWYADN